MAASGLVPTPEQIEAQFIARPLSISAEDFREMLRKAGLSTIANDKAQAAAYYNHVFGTIAPEMLATNEVLTNTLLAALTGPPDPVAIAAARDLGARQTKRIWGDLARSELNKIGGVIEKGILDGRGPREVARRLETVTGLDPQRAGRLAKMEDYLRIRGLSEEAVEQGTASFKRKLIRDRREFIARTEMRLATEAGNQNAAVSGGKKWKASISAGDSRVDEDDCQPNEAQGWIPIDESFSSGHDAPPYHPGCRCVASYRARPPGPAAQKRADRRADKTTAAKKLEADVKAEAKAVKAELSKTPKKPTKAEAPLRKSPREQLVEARAERIRLKEALDRALERNDRKRGQLADLNKRISERTASSTALRARADALKKQIAEAEAGAKAFDDRIRRRERRE